MILKQAQHRFNGLSTDNKNSIAESCALFHEMDTNKYYSKDGTNWYDVTNVINTDWKHVTPDPKLPKTSTILPSEYIECEYLDTNTTSVSADSAYIDTGYAYTDPDEIRIVSTYMKDASSGNGSAFGVDFVGKWGDSFGSTPRRMHGHMWSGYGYHGLYLGTDKVAEASKDYCGNKITLDFTYNVTGTGTGKAVWVITNHDDNDATETVTYEGSNHGWVGTDVTDFLGMTHSVYDSGLISGDNKRLNGKIYRHTMYHHNVKVRDFIPCIRRADNKPGFYDLVNQKFYMAGKSIVYGFHVDSTVSDPSNAITYLEDAVGFTPAAMDFTAGTFSYGSWSEDEFFMPRPCMVKFDGTRDYYLNPNDYTKKEDGTASDVANVNYGGNAMMEWGRNGSAIWYKLENDSSVSGNWNFYVANNRVDDDYHAWNFVNKNDQLIEHFYTAIYFGWVDSNDRLRSISGQTLINSKHISENVTAARLMGDSWNIECFADVQLLWLLCVLLGKSFCVQDVFGQYRSTTNKLTGVLNTSGLFYGGNTATSCVKVFGMEDIWTSTMVAINGLLIDDSNLSVYYKLTEGTADGSTASGYSLTSTAGMLTSGSLPTVTEENATSVGAGTLNVVNSSTAPSLHIATNVDPVNANTRLCYQRESSRTSNIYVGIYNAYNGWGKHIIIYDTIGDGQEPSQYLKYDGCKLSCKPV